MPGTISPQPLPKYRDKWIQLIGIPVITLFGYYLTYNNIRLNLLLAYELVSDAFKIFVVWQMVRWIIIWLDRHYPWQHSLVRRLAVQIPLTCLAGMLVLALLVHLEYFFIRPYPLENFFNLDLVIALIFLLLCNIIYVSLYYYDSYLQSLAAQQALTQKLKEEKQHTTAHFVVKLGKREVVVPYTQILCFYSEEKETFLLTTDNRTYLADVSLDKLEEQLPAYIFFRANRKFILSAPLVESVQAETHGKLTVRLKLHQKLPEQVSISRDKAPAFRKWLKQ